MEAHAGGDAVGAAAGEVDGKAYGLEPVRAGPLDFGRQTDHDEADDAGGARSLEDRIGPLLEVTGIEVAMRVGEAEHRGRERSPLAGATLGPWPTSPTQTRREATRRRRAAKERSLSSRRGRTPASTSPGGTLRPSASSRRVSGSRRTSGTPRVSRRRSGMERTSSSRPRASRREFDRPLADHARPSTSPSPSKRTSASARAGRAWPSWRVAARPAG